VTLNGTVSSNGASTTVSFQFGATTGYGNSVAATQSPLPAGALATAVSAAISGLTCNTLYHFRAVGVNSAGTTNGADASFTTGTCSADDNFPPACQLPVGWTQPAGANAGWMVATDSIYRGACSLKSATIGDDQFAAIQVAGMFAAGDISFAARVSSESGYDLFEFYIDDELQVYGSGNLEWTPRSTAVTITLDVLNGATTPPDSTVVANKLGVAAYYTAKVAAGCAHGTEQEGVTSLTSVTANAATVTAAKAAIDGRCAP
jgi:hypothetical protein